jgi:hypothetical protein
MNVEELQENTEHAQHSGQRSIGLTTAVVAVLLAVATLLGHRSHTEEILALTQNVDQWDFYQAKHNRAYQFALAAETQALLPNGADPAVRNLKTSIEEECGIPVRKDCTSPLLKRSLVLQQLMEQHGKPAAGATEKQEPHAEPTAAVATVSEKHEAPSKEGSGKEGSGKESVVKEGAVQIQDKAKEMQVEIGLLQQKSNYFDTAELFLEVSIVLCSIALLAEAKLYWRLSFLSTIAGVALAAWGWFLH